MAGPADYELPEPHNAVAYLTPRTSPEEPLITPDGYNVRVLSQAIAWLNKVHARDGEGFELPDPKGDVDRFTGRDITYGWSRVPRDAKHEDGSHQNDAEHSAVAGLTAIEVLGRLGVPRYIVGEVVMYALVHDRPEAPGNDIGIFDPRRPEKPYREAASETILAERDKDNPLMADLMKEARTLSTEAARINDSLEKSEPGLHALSTKCKTQRERNDEFPVMVRKQLQGASTHEIGFNVSKDLSKLLGANWIKWGCAPFEGDPSEIVDNIAREIMEGQSQAKVYQFPRKALTPEAVKLDMPPEPSLLSKIASVTRLSDWVSAGQGLPEPDPLAA